MVEESNKPKGLPGILGIKKICNKCKIIRRYGITRVICENPRHKQRQG